MPEKPKERYEWTHTPGVCLDHDIIDARKHREMKASDDSFAFAEAPKWDRLSRQRYRAYQQGEVRFVGDKDKARRIMSQLFLYLYRGREAICFPAEDETSEIANNLVAALDNSMFGKHHRSMSIHRQWHADLMARMIFDEVFAAMPPEALNNENAGAPPPPEEEESEEQQPDEENGDGSGEGEGEQEGAPPQVNEQAQQAIDNVLQNLETKTKNEKMPDGQTIDEAMDTAHGADEDETENPFQPSHFRLTMEETMGGITHKMGRLRSVMNAREAERIEFAPGATVSLMCGNDIRNVVPNEIALLADPATEILFDYKYIQKALVQRKTEGTSRGGMGPIIFCIDTSGSMRGEKVEWAKALAGSLGYYAASHGRDVAFIFYSSSVPDIICLDFESQSDLKVLESSINSIVYSTKIGRGDPHKHSVCKAIREMGINPMRKPHVNMMGTNYYMAFDAALELMQVHKTWERADLLFLTDGDDAGHSPINQVEELRNRYGVRVFGLVLDEMVRQERYEEKLHYFDAFAMIDYTKPEDEVIKAIATAL